MKKLTVSLVAAGIVLTGAACSGSDSGSQSAAWSADAKDGVRQLMAMGSEGEQLDCATDVITDLYSPEDWTFIMAKGFSAMGDEEEAEPLSDRLQDKETEATKLMDTRCGIEDTSEADAQEASEMEAWNDAVDEWSTLVEARDAAGDDMVTVDGETFDSYEDWAEANDKPVEMP